MDIEKQYSSDGDEVKQPLYTAQEKQYVGLKGWIILPIVGMFVSVFMLLKAIFQAVQDVSKYFDQIRSSSILPLFYFELTANLFLCLLMIANLVCVFMKKRSLPKQMIGLYIANSFVVLFDAIWSASLGLVQTSSIPVICGTLIGSVIWIIYFHTSQRVQNTFVR